MNITCVLVGLLAASWAPHAQTQAGPSTGAQTAAPPVAAAAPAELQRFRDEVAKYVRLQRQARDEVGDLRPNSSAQQVTATSDALATAVRRARPKASQGDFFDATAAAFLRERLASAVREANLVEALAKIDDEPPAIRAPKIYLRYPAASQMATMPPSILGVLPPLPEELEFRIVGRALVLRDIKAALVIDFIPDALPPR